jgi:hypothetical protein
VIAASTATAASALTAPVENPHDGEDDGALRQAAPDEFSRHRASAPGGQQR